MELPAKSPVPNKMHTKKSALVFNIFLVEATHYLGGGGVGGKGAPFSVLALGVTNLCHVTVPTHDTL